MSRLRAIGRASCFLGLTMVMLLLWYGGRFCLPLTAHWRWRNRLLRWWAGRVIRLCHITLQRDGPLPQPPFLLVSNHLSYLDLLLLMAQVDAVFVAKHELGQWPIIGPFGRSIGNIFINRHRLRDVPVALNEITQRLQAGQAVILFAEGTTSPGNQVRPFYSSLLEAAIRLQMPVAYASLSYRTPPTETPAYQAVCWWGDMTFVDHFFALLHLTTIEATLSFGPQPIQATDRKLCAKKLHRAVRAQFIPVTTREIPTYQAHTFPTMNNELGIPWITTVINRSGKFALQIKHLYHSALSKL